MLARHLQELPALRGEGGRVAELPLLRAGCQPRDGGLSLCWSGLVFAGLSREARKVRTMGAGVPRFCVACQSRAVVEGGLPFPRCPCPAWLKLQSLVPTCLVGGWMKGTWLWVEGRGTLLTCRAAVGAVCCLPGEGSSPHVPPVSGPIPRCF